MDQPVEVLVDMAQWIALFGFVVSPPVLSLLKNIGTMWSKTTKNRVAMVLAVAGALGSYALATDLSAVNLNDWEGLWIPLVFGVAGMTMTQYASFKVLWSGALAPVENALAGAFAPKDPGE